MTWTRFALFLILVLSATQFHLSQATGSETGDKPGLQNEDAIKTELSSAELFKLVELMEGGSPKASEDNSSSPSFAKGIWGAFLFSLIGIAVFVAALIFLIRFFDRKPGRAASRSTSNQNLVHDTPAQRNITASPEAQPFPPPSAASTFENRAMTFDEPPPSTYPPQQYQFQPPPNNYGNQQFYGQEPPSSDAQPIFSRFHPPNESYPPPATTPVTPQSTMSPPPAYNFPPPSSTPVTPVTPVYYQQSKSAESEYNGDYSDYYATKEPEDPFKYLDKYSPYTTQEQMVDTTDESSPKRAVLRHSTPYKVIEDRVQGEDYDDSDTFAPYSGLNPAPPKKPLSSNGSFNDGKSRLVRVLPRFHHVPSTQNQQEVGTTAVFKPVAPAPPAPPPADYY